MEVVIAEWGEYEVTLEDITARFADLPCGVGDDGASFNCIGRGDEIRLAVEPTRTVARSFWSNSVFVRGDGHLRRKVTGNRAVVGAFMSFGFADFIPLPRMKRPSRFHLFEEFVVD